MQCLLLFFDGFIIYLYTKLYIKLFLFKFTLQIICKNVLIDICNKKKIEYLSYY